MLQGPSRTSTSEKRPRPQPMTKVTPVSEIENTSATAFRRRRALWEQESRQIELALHPGRGLGGLNTTLSHDDQGLATPSLSNGQPKYYNPIAKEWRSFPITIASGSDLTDEGLNEVGDWSLGEKIGDSEQKGLRKRDKLKRVTKRVLNMFGERSKNDEGGRDSAAVNHRKSVRSHTISFTTPRFLPGRSIRVSLSCHGGTGTPASYRERL